MDAKICLKKLQYVGVLNFATVGLDGLPHIRCISAIHYEEDSFCFFTARGKEFARELDHNGQVEILGYTRYKEMIRVQAKASKIEDTLQKEYIDMIFREQPYLSNVYPQETRNIGVVYEVKDMTIEYFNLGVKPIFRETYILGIGKKSKKGFEIKDTCISCGKCISACPQQAITLGAPSYIHEEHCLHCGNCYEVCPVHAVIRKDR